MGALQAGGLWINSTSKKQNGVRAAGSKKLPNNKSGEQCLLFYFEVSASGWSVS